jgi:hypothetical protein
MDNKREGFMKTWFICGMGLAVSAAMLSGCNTIPSQTQAYTENAAAGLLICEPNELCPVVTVAWNEQLKDTASIHVALNSAKKDYDIQKISLSNSQKNIEYAAVSKTEYDVILGMHRSKNSITVPSKIFTELNSGKNISLTVHTDQGALKRYIYKDGKQSLLYQQLKAIAQK